MPPSRLWRALLVLLAITALGSEPVAAQRLPAEAYADSLDSHVRLLRELGAEIAEALGTYAEGQSGYNAHLQLDFLLAVAIQDLDWSAFTLRLYAEAAPDSLAPWPVRRSVRRRLLDVAMRLRAGTAAADDLRKLCQPSDCDPEAYGRLAARLGEGLERGRGLVDLGSTRSTPRRIR